MERPQCKKCILSRNQFVRGVFVPELNQLFEAHGLSDFTTATYVLLNGSVITQRNNKRYLNILTVINNTRLPARRSFNKAKSFLEALGYSRTLTFTAGGFCTIFFLCVCDSLSYIHPRRIWSGMSNLLL